MYGLACDQYTTNKGCFVNIFMYAESECLKVSGTSGCITYSSKYESDLFNTNYI